jgi:Ca-activated chloride channel family protein
MERGSDRLPVAVVVAGAIAVLSVSLLGEQQPPQFRAGTQIVSLFVTVTDVQQRLVPDLLQEDFEVLDNGRPQPITFFENHAEPVTMIVMLDKSGSMTSATNLLLAAAEQFLLRLLPADRGRVGAFHDRVEFASGFTSDRDDLIASLKDLDFGNGTRLYDAIAMSLDELKGHDGRRVILIFSDGQDNSSRTRQGTVIERARAEEVMVYSIGLRSEYFDGIRMVRSQPDDSMKRLAEETGGGYFELQRTADLGPTFTRVAQELHSQYSMGFTPTSLDGRVHRLEVRVKRSGMTARARRSYVADPERFAPANPQ